MTSDALTASALAARLADPEWCEAPVTDAISPLTVVALTEPLTTTLPTALPRLVVGIGTGVEAPGLDSVVAGDEELQAIADACATNPRAVGTLAQLLRISVSLPVADALVAESLAYSTLLSGAEFRRWHHAQPARDHRASARPVVVAYDGDEVTITLDRPEVRNAYDAAMRDALVDALRPLAALTSPPTIRLRGAGRSFCSGGDLSEFGTNDDLAAAHLVRAARAPGPLLHVLAPVVTASVHGACVGAGVELPAFCGRVEAAPDTTFRLPEIAMGLVPGAGGTVSLPRRVGRQRAAWLAVSGRAIDAPRARAWGLVDAIVP